MPNSIPGNSGCWAFVLNPIVIESELPFEFAPNCFINKATVEQRQRIKEALTKKFRIDGAWRLEHYYECEAITELTDNGESTNYVPLPESEWSYYVVSTPGNGNTNIDLHLASNISEIALEISALRFYPNFGYGERAGILQNHFEGWPLPAKRIGVGELKDISEVYQSFVGFKDNTSDCPTYPEILRAMNMYDSLSLLRKNSEFHVLGLFAIIEMLITHNPKLEDRGDSITHQMQSKIPLLSRRFAKPLDYTCFFSDAAEKKVWAALYGYRSAIAHGGIVDFKSKDFCILKDVDNANAFLREMVKALLRHALTEPQLYRDLRNC